MSNLKILADIIKTALNQPNNKIRSEAENKLLSYRDSNPNEFYFNCALIVQNQEFDNNTRQCAGTVVSYLIRQRNANTGNLYWDEIHPQRKQQIKSKFLSALIYPDNGIVKGCAIVLAIIASFELPRGEWHNIVDTFAQNCTNNDKAVQNASITTLGYICEEIKRSNQNINQHLSEQILGAIIVGTKQPDENIIRTSLKALEDSLYFLSYLMKKENIRTQIFQVFVNNFKNKIFVEETYRALYQFVKAASPFLGSYSQIFVDLTESHLESRDQISVLNLQMWDIIGNDYYEKINRMKNRVNVVQKQQNFLQMVSEQVLPNLMKCLLIYNQQQEQEVDFRISAGRAIEAFVKVCDNSVIDMITNSVSLIINSPDPNHQQATVPLFSAICDFQNKEYVQKMFKTGLDHLFKLLDSQNKTVVRSSLNGFVRLSQSFAEVFLDDPNFDQKLKTIFSFVEVEVPDIRKTAINILVNISEGIEKESNYAHQDPKPFLTTVVSYFCQNKINFLANQNQNLQSLVNIIFNILMNTHDNLVKTQLIQYMISQYYQVNKLQIHGIRTIVDYIIGIIHTAVLALKQSIGSPELLNKLCELTNFHIKKYGIESQGLTIISALANAYGKQFEARFGTYWPCVQKALENPNDLTTYKSALACVGDLARIMQASFVNEALPILRNLINNIAQSLDRQIKLNILTCMGDLILCLQHSAEYVVNETLQIIQISSSAVIELINNGTDQDYTQELKSNIIDLYSCLAFAVQGSRNARKSLLEDYSHLATFVVRTCDKSLNPTIEYLKNSVMLVYDLAAFLISLPDPSNRVKTVIKSKQISQLLTILMKYGDSTQIAKMVNAVEEKFRV